MMVVLNTLRSRMVPMFGLWLILLVHLSGCATLADLDERPDPVQDQVVGYDEVLLNRFWSDQKQRQKIAFWGVQGIFDIESPDHSRRLRVKFSGQGVDRARMQVYGPFRQIVMDLRLLPEQILLIDPGLRKILKMPPNAASMDRLLTASLEPHRLVDMVLAVCGDISSASGANNRHSGVLTVDGERIQLDETHGRMVRRAGRTEDSQQYQVTYLWPESAESSTKLGVVMPKEVVVTLMKETRIELKFKRWNDREDRSLSEMKLPSDFQWYESMPESVH